MTQEIDKDLMEKADRIAVSSRNIHCTCVMLKNDIAHFAQEVRDEEYLGDKGYIKVCQELAKERHLADELSEALTIISNRPHHPEFVEPDDKVKAKQALESHRKAREK